MPGAVGTMIVAAGLLPAWKALPGVLAGRLITGVSVGLAARAAITYLIELRAREEPSPSALIRARNIGTAVSVGGLGIGPLIAGFLAEWASYPLTLPCLVFLGLGALALIGVATALDTRASRCVFERESGERSVTSRPGSGSGAMATPVAFAATGLFAGLSGLFLAVVAVAQTPEGLTGSALRVGSKAPKVIACLRRALLGLSAAGPPSDGHSQRSPGFRRGLCATATLVHESGQGLGDVRGSQRTEPQGPCPVGFLTKRVRYPMVFEFGAVNLGSFVPGGPLERSVKSVPAVVDGPDGETVRHGARACR
jgi:MFS family permease